MNVPLRALAAALLALAACRSPSPRPAVVYLTDFGLADGAVAAMKGVARGVEPALVLDDLTHGVAPFDVWQAAYRLRQALPYWPEGTVFVCVVDPGVGTARRSVVACTGDGKLVVTPDNGTLTLVAEELGVVHAREIDAAIRRPGSEESPTFHGRDVYSLTGALLASGELALEAVGEPVDPASLVRLDHLRPTARLEDGAIVASGMLPVLDPAFGNVWTNLPVALFRDRLVPGALLDVVVRRSGEEVHAERLPFARTFGDVPVGAPLAYANSLGRLAFALHRGDFAGSRGLDAGPAWTVEVRVGRRGSVED